MKKLFAINKNRGYALYTAIILTGVLILVSYITANLSIKQLLLSVSGADSHVAFYNTDSGLECALYADLQNGPTSAFDAVSPSPTITCNGGTIPLSPGTDASGNPTSTFQLTLSQGCATVTVTKIPSTATTLIESRGYNVCSGSHKLERGVKIQY